MGFKINRPDEAAAALARKHWASVAKPLGSLGMLENIIVKIAGITGSERVDISRRAVAVMCADNGVTAEGVTQTGSEVTRIVSENIALGKASVCRMAQIARADVFAYDVGINGSAPNCIGDIKIKSGTQNIAKGPAMTRAECESAVDAGINTVRRLKERGYKIIVGGEMGIGNTTASSAVVSVLLGCDPAEVTGKGAGLSSEGVAHKTEVIRRAIALNKPDPKDAADVLAKVGGLDIAALAGLFIGGAVFSVPVVIDGFITSAAALAAERLAPGAVEYMIASHISGEYGGRIITEALGLDAPIDADMRLGEGTGGVCLLPLLDMALAVYNEVYSFEDAGIEPYKPL